MQFLQQIGQIAEVREESGSPSQSGVDRSETMQQASRGGAGVNVLEPTDIGLTIEAVTSGEQPISAHRVQSVRPLYHLKLIQTWKTLLENMQENLEKGSRKN